MKKYKALLKELEFESSAKKKHNGFYSFDIDRLDEAYKNAGEDFWINEGQKNALKLFHLAAKRVPAYKNFLKKHGINHDKIENINDFEQVPVTTKKNYIIKYKVEERCWDGVLNNSKIIALSSGMTGDATIWPRGSYQENEAAIVHELLYKKLFKIDKYKTLVVICFPMGVYVSGVATILPTFHVSTKAYNLAIASPGINPKESFKILKDLEQKYEQVILAGHPLFIKNIIEETANNGIKWKKNKLKLMLCSDSFSEEWRDYIMRKANITISANILGTYGSSDMLLMAYETKDSINLRRLFNKNKALREKMFGSFVPNLFQYNPWLRFIEVLKNDLVFTVKSGVPLVRYNIGDSGKIINLNQIKEKFKIFNNSEWQLPFLALYGRGDETVIYHAFNIYPEHIKTAININALMGKLTGKFNIQKKYRKNNMDEYLEINFELRKNVKANKNLSKKIKNQVDSSLKKTNIEYKETGIRLGEKISPKVNLYEFQTGEYFKPGNKPKYIIKQDNRYEKNIN